MALSHWEVWKASARHKEQLLLDILTGSRLIPSGETRWSLYEKLLDQEKVNADYEVWE